MTSLHPCTRRRARSLPLVLSLSTAAVLLAACSSDDSDDNNGPPPPAGTFTLDGVVQDAPVDDLLSFSATVDSIQLIATGGAVTADLLADDVRLEFLGLQAIGAWLFRNAPDDGTYTGMRVTLLPGSIEARDTAGAVVAVTEVATTFDVTFPAALAVDDSGYERVVVDLNLAESLTGDVASPPILFDPVGTVSTSNGSSSYTIDEVRGSVVSANAGANTLVLDAFADDDLTIALGEVTVAVPSTATLVDDDDSFFADRTAFFAALTAGSTVLEVHGALVGDGVTATRIEVEDQNGGVNSAGVVKIEGRVVAHNVGTSFDLALIEIEKGASIADPVLSGLGNPAVLTVTYDVTTRFVDESHASVGSSALAVGQRVDVKFAAFTGNPFFGVWVEIDESADHSATVHDVSGLPNTLIVRLRSGEAAITAGLVQSDTTDVTVDLTSATVYLDVEDDPAFAAADLVEGLRVNVRGAVEGIPTAPTIDASRLRVRPGRLEGTVSGIDEVGLTFDVTVTSIDDPFATNVTSGTVTVVIDPSCVFEDDADDAASFFALFNGLEIGEELEVEVKGVGTGTADEVRAFEIEAEVD